MYLPPCQTKLTYVSVPGKAYAGQNKTEPNSNLGPAAIYAFENISKGPWIDISRHITELLPGPSIYVYQ